MMLETWQQIETFVSVYVFVALQLFYCIHLHAAKGIFDETNISRKKIVHIFFPIPFSAPT